MLIALFTLSLSATPTFAQSLEDRLKSLEETIQKQAQDQKALRETLKKQEQTIDEQRKLIEDMKAEIKQGQPSGSLNAHTFAFAGSIAFSLAAILVLAFMWKGAGADNLKDG